MIILFVRLKSKLPEEELIAIAKERKPRFEALPGLVQKYYVRTGEPGELGGIYVWDSRESLDEYRKSELARTIAEAYGAIEPPRIETFEVLFPLRD